MDIAQSEPLVAVRLHDQFMPENIACQRADSDRLRILFGEREGIGMD